MIIRTTFKQLIGGAMERKDQRELTIDGQPNKAGTDMILSLNAPSGSTISLDFAKLFGTRVELEAFQFILPPVDFRLVRGDKPLQEWQKGNSEIYDLQHCPGVKNWARDAHWFTNDLDHRNDVITCGILSRDLAMQPRGLGPTFVLMIWLRQGTWAMQEPPIASRIRN